MSCKTPYVRRMPLGSSRGYRIVATIWFVHRRSSVSEISCEKCNNINDDCDELVRKYFCLRDVNSVRFLETTLLRIVAMLLEYCRILWLIFHFLT